MVKLEPDVCHDKRGNCACVCADGRTKQILDLVRFIYVNFRDVSMKLEGCHPVKFWLSWGIKILKFIAINVLRNNRRNKNKRNNRYRSLGNGFSIFSHHFVLNIS